MPATFQPIATQTISGVNADVVFSNIPGTYTDLVLIVNATQATTLGSLFIRFNADTGSNYSDTIMLGDGSTPQSARQSNTTSMRTGLIGNNPGNTILYIMDYANTTTNKTVLSRGNVAANQSRAGVGLWRNTAAINALTVVTNNQAITGTFTLYGIKAG